MQGFLFDLDGTLVDTAVDMIAALKLLAAENGINANPEYSKYKELVTYGSRAIVTSIFGHLSDQSIMNLQQRYLEIYQNCLTSNSHLFDGIEEVIKHLDKHHIAWGIVTNKPEYLAQPLIKTLKPLNSCKILIGGDSTNHSKPHPEPINAAIRFMSIDPLKSWYIGDAKSDMTAANAAQMNSAVAMWGYLGVQDHPEQWQADSLLSHPLKILKLI